MSQQQDGYPPPPTPGGASFLQPRRQQSGQPPLLTTVFNRSYGSQLNTPLPGSAASTPLSPMFPQASSSYPSASMSSGSYNPRQWSQSGRPSGYAESSRAASGGSNPGGTRESTGMEPSMPSPPPPYTPPTPTSTLAPGRQAATHNNDLYVSSPLANNFPPIGQSSSRSSPQMQMGPHFPPPPSRDKVSTRNERDSSRPKFSLSAFSAIVKRPDLKDTPSQPNSPVFAPAEASIRPPAGRRAISTGGIGLPNASTGSTQQSRRPSPESSGWEPGMPLPPPPPGPPPPPSGRSHSLNRYGHQRPIEPSGDVLNNVRASASVRASHYSTLGAVPPTPAGWVEDDPIPQTHSVPPVPQLPMESEIIHATDHTRIQVASLTRRPARREPSADSILERRSKSRAGKDISYSDETDHQVSPPQLSSSAAFPKPAKLVLSSTDPLLQRRLMERTERAELSAGKSVGQVSPEAANRQSRISGITALTPPYTPAIKSQSNNSKRMISDSPAKAAMDPRQDAFVQSSLERFHMFIQQEASSPSDRDRLELFANFMVQESRIRRDLYSVAFNSMAGEIMDLTRDMWRSGTPGGPTSGNQAYNENSIRQAPRVSASPDGSLRFGHVPAESSCSSATEFTPATDTESICDNSESVEDKPPPATPWGERFQPSLSPIRSVPSMAVSTVPDGEEGSRGRSASRWWEGSGEGSVGQGGRKLEMTKQESRYMSLHPKELIVAAQPSPSHSTPTPNTTSTSFRYGPDEYPPEKVGLDEERVSPASSYPMQSDLLRRPDSAQRGKQPIKPSLDVSRLVTLPPPYPRHYPALQNNHPSLNDIRSRHREIAETISVRQSKPQTDYCWQTSVYSDMLQTCEQSIAELVRRLEETAENQHTTSAQTEGDERPELLEELTLLKWIFEAREQLQKQDFDASMQRAKVRSSTYTSHCQAVGDYVRLQEEENRLAHHLQHSQLHFAEQATYRYTHLLRIIEHYVNSGVEVQLSAFWDIAPSLLEVVQKVPAQNEYALADLSVLVPSAEVADNPSYRVFPLQYLLRTLDHAKKSAYQFIESQTNLLCLLHEVKTASMSAEVRLGEIRRISRGEDERAVRGEMARVKRLQEEEETGVLKERVGVLEGQWESALGSEIEAVVQKVGSYLQGQGGWDEADGL